MRILAQNQNKKTQRRNERKLSEVYVQSEHDLQVQCVSWFRTQYPPMALLLFAVPNGEKREVITKMTDKGVKSYCPAGQRLKDEGALRGVADLFLLRKNSRYGALFIEMKTVKGRQSPEQKEWQKLVEGAGYRYVICRTLEGFMDEVQKYLQIE